jgi:hypothetical protein
MGHDAAAMSQPWSSSPVAAGDTAPRARPRVRLAAVALLAACSTFAPPTNVLVTRTPPGDRAVQEEGTSAHLSRWEIGLAREGLKRGFFVVKSDIEWRGLWPTTDPDKVPLLPYDIDFAREMLLVSSPADPDATASEVRTVILTDRAVHVYVTQTVLGTDCPSSQDAAAKNYDLVRVQRVDDKDVSFHIDTVFGEPCGRPPEAGITCKADRTTDPLVENLKVEPGTKVACVASGLRSTRPIFDLTWLWDALPIGSAAKIDVARGSRGVTFVPEVIGTYRIALEVSDDLARKGKVTGEVNVPPPAAPLALQMVWTKLDANDDPDTFPRIELHAYGLPPEMSRSMKPTPTGAAPKTPTIAWGAVKNCTVSAPQPWCTAKLAGSTTLMTLDASSAQQFALAVRYTDERVPGQPVLCVRAYRDGKQTAERCDSEKRNAEAWWDLGLIDSLTGKTPDALALERAAAARAAAAADAGPGEGGAGAVTDAASKDAPTGDVAVARD